MVKKSSSFLWVSLLSLLLVGCSTNITNLTPKQTSRNANGFYPIEAAFKTTQQSLRWSSVKPSVIVGKEFFPMRSTPMMTNRWETLIQVPAGVNVVYYRFKFDYTYNNFGTPPQPNSKLSPTYRLEISDK